MRSAGPRRRGGPKPKDVGTGVVCASFAPSGAWLSLAGVHARHGFVELTGMPVFDERERGDAAAVRRYRALMADQRSAFLTVEPRGSTVVRSRLPRQIAGRTTIVQKLQLRGPPEAEEGLAIWLRFGGRLDVPALAMITEAASPRTLGSATNRTAVAGRTLEIRSASLATQAEITVEGGLGGAEWQLIGPLDAVLKLAWPAGVTQATVTVSCRLATVHRDAPTRGPARRAAAPPLSAEYPALAVPPDLWPALDRIHRRALRYVRECTALRVAPGRVTILTDHRLLPLSWTRDAYWQALLLLRHGAARTVADHLRWLWLDCDRPQVSWARSHHADGRRHDDIYQADQQLYPLLELADYHATTGSLPELDAPAGGRTWPALVGEVVADLGRRIVVDGLLATDENAADDPAGLPYLMANHVLAWHAFARLAEVPQLGEVEPSPAWLAGRVRDAVARHFAVEGPAGRLWAYAVDGGGSAIVHHDANDLPTALAPLWGFCAPSDPLWRGTVDFAFSRVNDAYSVGRVGGLGSRHTPGVWPLGLIQEWVARSLTGEAEAAADSLRRLISCALADWSLPEASDPQSGRLLARHWFAWPGAALGTLLAVRQR